MIFPIIRVWKKDSRRLPKRVAMTDNCLFSISPLKSHSKVPTHTDVSVESIAKSDNCFIAILALLECLLDLLEVFLMNTWLS